MFPVCELCLGHCTCTSVNKRCSSVCFQVFIKDLVWNLFGEGNDVFKEGDWTKSIEMYTEALSVADYANSEDICVAKGLLEKLYANRAAAYLSIVPVSCSSAVVIKYWISLFCICTKLFLVWNLKTYSMKQVNCVANKWCEDFIDHSADLNVSVSVSARSVDP